MDEYKILVIDDDFINRKLLVEILRNKLYRVKTIESVDGRDALDIIEEERDIQFILLDIEMPKINGLEFLDIYKTKNIKKVPIIAISSNDSRKKESLIKGSSAFITKPVTERKLMKAIRNSVN